LKHNDIDAPLAGLTYQLPDTIPKEGIFVVDTSDLFAALEGDGETNRRSLDRVCKHLQIYTEYLHNAGNDAYVRVCCCQAFCPSHSHYLQYTLLAMKSMASGDPVDIQREKRWPKRTQTTGSQGTKVQFQPWEENSDYSDQEGLVPPIRGYDPITGKLLSHNTNSN
jgi:hypothetical protein